MYTAYTMITLYYALYSLFTISHYICTGFKSVIKVYEAPNPQRVWQAVLLEGLDMPEKASMPEKSSSQTSYSESLPSSSTTPNPANLPGALSLAPPAPTSTTSTSSSSAHNTNTTTTSTTNTITPTPTPPTAIITLEQPDKDELALREYINQERKQYFKLICIEQKNGFLPNLSPRVDISECMYLLLCVYLYYYVYVYMRMPMYACI